MKREEDLGVRRERGRNFKKEEERRESWKGKRGMEEVDSDSHPQHPSTSDDGEVQSPPFKGLVICVTGLSKEARNQVKESTERLGGFYSPILNPSCTHLLVFGTPFTLLSHPLGGRKLRHALTPAFRNRLFVVTLSWFFDCLTSLAKLNESPYLVHISTGPCVPISSCLFNSKAACDSCSATNLKLPPMHYDKTERQTSWSYEGNFGVDKPCFLSGHSIYVDLDICAELRRKVVDVVLQEGVMLLNQWFVGCGADYVVCEGHSILRYLGHCNSIVSPMWILKTFKGRALQRFVGLSADLAREVGVMLENLQHMKTEQETSWEKCHEYDLNCHRNRVSQAERLQNVNLAKSGIRKRRARRLQSCKVPLRPINPSSLLDTLYWSISEPTSRAAVYADSSTSDSEICKEVLSDGWERVESDISLRNLRPLVESEQNEIVFRNHFLTILFPVDRFAEMGPVSRTYFSDTGFTCLQLLNFIYDFYQENMPDHEIEVAIHTDSRHADQLRSVYCSETVKGHMTYKRIEFLGSRKSFEMLKRVSGNNNCNVYELLIRE